MVPAQLAGKRQGGRTKQMTESRGTSADSVSCMRRRIASASLMPVGSARPAVATQLREGQV